MKRLFFLAAAFVITTWLGGMNTTYCSMEKSTIVKTEKLTPMLPGIIGVAEAENTDLDLKCIDHRWEYLSVDCATIDGKPAYCFKLIIYKAKECEKFKYSINQSLVPGSVGWTYDNAGNLIIKGCFWAQAANNPLCVKIDFSNPLCCDFVACTKLPCCEKVKWEGAVYCKKYNGQWAYYYKVRLYGVKPCGKFKFITNYPTIPGTQQTIYNTNGDATVIGWILASSVPPTATKLCFKVDFKDPLCCDFSGCIKLPPCCGDPKWKGEVKCDYIDGQKVYCYYIKIADAKECDGVKVAVDGTLATPQTITYDANGNAIVQGCVLASSLPSLKLCFKVDYKNPACCDFDACMKLPPCPCIEKSYGFDQLSCHVVDGKKVFCFVFVVKEAKECLKFDYTVNGTTVEGPSMSYGPSGELYIKHCVTDVLGDKLCLKIDWLSDMCCDIKTCVALPPCIGLQGQLPGLEQRNLAESEVEGTKIKVYPVPADDYLRVVLPERNTPSVITLTDMNKKQVLKMAPITNEATVYTGAMPTGIYLIQLYDVNGTLLDSKQVQILHK